MNAKGECVGMNLPASQFNGESASGSSNNAMIALHADCNPQAGVHSFFKISKQMLPFCTLDESYEEFGGIQIAAYLEMHVRMKDLGVKFHVRRNDRIMFHDLYFEFKHTYIGSTQHMA